MRGLYSKLYAKSYRAALSIRVISILIRRVAALMEFRPMVARPLARKPEFIFYTDAALVRNQIATALFEGQSGTRPVIKLLAVSSVPKYWAIEFIRTNMIYGVEMLALLAFIFTMRRRLAGKSINIYIDNNNVLCSLIRGDSDT